MTKKANNTKKSFEERLKEKKQLSQELKFIAQRAIKEWPSIKEFNQALRYLEVFAQLMKLKPFLKWMIENIEVHDQIDHKQKTIDTYVVYKGPEKLGDDEIPAVVKDEVPAATPVDTEESSKRSLEQNIVRCPNCQLLFDANVHVPLIEIAEKLPESIK